MTHNLNFLEHTEPQPPEQRHGHGSARTLVIIGGLLLSLLAVWIIALAVAAGQVFASALDGKDALERARSAAVALQFEDARKELASANTSFIRAHQGFVVLGTLQFVPWVGPQIQAADAMVVSGRDVTQALDEILALGSELFRLSGLSEEDFLDLTEGLSPDVTFDDLSSETKIAILERLSTSASDLELVVAKIDIALKELARVERDELIGPIADALDPLTSELIDLRSALQTVAIVAVVLPEFAGLEETKTHLLLFLNNAEIRPGGGFVGTYGVLQLRGGDIQQLDTKDVYTLDRAAEPFIHVAPPEPLARYNATTNWFFRDANWSPDFARSAEELITAFYREVAAIPPEQRAAVQQSVTFDGVIGFTPDFASDLLEITGPLVAGGQSFTAQNVFDKLEYQVEFGYVGQGVPEAQRKEIVSELVNQMKSALFRLPFSEWERVRFALEQALQEKQIALYSTDERTQDVLERARWGGRVAPEGPDVQMLVDANLASLKSDPAVHREIAYEVFRDDVGRYVGRTNITYRHTGTFDWKTTRYRTYARLYVPEGSEWIRTQGSLLNDRLQSPTGAAAPTDIGTELSDVGLVSFGTFTSVEPGQVQTLTFEYFLAPSVVRAIEDGSYALDVLKQLGALPHTLTLDLNFGKTVVSAVPPEDSAEWGDDVFRLNTKLDQDLEFEVSF